MYTKVHTFHIWLVELLDSEQIFMKFFLHDHRWHAWSCQHELQPIFRPTLSLFIQRNNYSCPHSCGGKLKPIYTIKVAQVKDEKDVDEDDGSDVVWWCCVGMLSVGMLSVMMVCVVVKVVVRWNDWFYAVMNKRTDTFTVWVAFATVILHLPKELFQCKAPLQQAFWAQLKHYGTSISLNIFFQRSNNFSSLELA